MKLLAKDEVRRIVLNFAGCPIYCERLMSTIGGKADIARTCRDARY
jgi:hypothetical protein